MSRLTIISLFKGFLCGVGLAAWFREGKMGGFGLGCLWLGRRNGFSGRGLDPMTILRAQGWGRRAIIAYVWMLSDLYMFFNNQFNYLFDGKRSNRGFYRFYVADEEGNIVKFTCLMEKV